VVRREEDFPPGHPLPTPCRLWQGACDGKGYGVLSGNNLANKLVYAHRWVYALGTGIQPYEIPKGIVIRHLCDNPPCFRFSHLAPGTIADNNDDARRHNHLGPVACMRPSEFVLLFDLRDEGWTYKRIWEEHFQNVVTASRLRDIGRHGRDAYDENWQLIPPPDPLERYQDWRHRDR
jgi:hypothetical protein